MCRQLAIAVLVLMAAIPVLGNECHAQPILGTVTMLHENHLMIKTAEGREVTFTLGATTKYSKGDKPATKDDLAAGLRVSIRLSEDGKSVAAVGIGEKKAE